jgi:ribose 1,5-bisphosphokinase PhnN
MSEDTKKDPSRSNTLWFAASELFQARNRGLLLDLTVFLVSPFVIVLVSRQLIPLIERAYQGQIASAAILISRRRLCQRLNFYEARGRSC